MTTTYTSTGFSGTYSYVSTAGGVVIACTYDFVATM
jgi:hypothetical protein